MWVSSRAEIRKLTPIMNNLFLHNGKHFKYSLHINEETPEKINGGIVFFFFNFIRPILNHWLTSRSAAPSSAAVCFLLAILSIILLTSSSDISSLKSKSSSPSSQSTSLSSTLGTSTPLPEEMELFPDPAPVSLVSAEKRKEYLRPVKFYNHNISNVWLWKAGLLS